MKPDTQNVFPGDTHGHPNAATNTTERSADLMAGRMRGLADRLDDASERCAAKATNAKSQALEGELLTRAYVYQECAGLIREAMK